MLDLVSQIFLWFYGFIPDVNSPSYAVAKHEKPATTNYYTLVVNKLKEVFVVKLADFKLLNTSSNKIIDVFKKDNDFYTLFNKIKIVDNKIVIDGSFYLHLKIIKQ